jgi:hypothetical protein
MRMTAFGTAWWRLPLPRTLRSVFGTVWRGSPASASALATMLSWTGARAVPPPTTDATAAARGGAGSASQAVAAAAAAGRPAWGSCPPPATRRVRAAASVCLWGAGWPSSSSLVAAVVLVVPLCAAPGLACWTAAGGRRCWTGSAAAAAALPAWRWWETARRGQHCLAMSLGGCCWQMAVTRPRRGVQSCRGYLFFSCGGGAGGLVSFSFTEACQGLKIYRRSAQPSEKTGKEGPGRAGSQTSPPATTPQQRPVISGHAEVLHAAMPSSMGLVGRLYVAPQLSLCASPSCSLTKNGGGGHPRPPQG